MEMEFISILRVMKRWWWLILFILLGAAGGLFVYFQSLDDVYMAEVTIHIIRPENEDIEVYDERNYTELRNEIINTLNKFIDAAAFPEVRRRTLAELNITEDYTLDITTRAGADFVFIQVFASTPELARDIANVHAEQSIQYFGELRANSLNEAVIFFEEQTQLAKQELADAEQALTDFRIEHGIVSVSDELEIANRVLERLSIVQAETNFNNTVTEINQSILDAILQGGESGAERNPEAIDNLISLQRDDLSEMLILAPEYQLLVNTVDIAREKYNKVAEKYVEAQLRESFTSRAFFIQIIREAGLPTSTENDTLRILMFTIVASVGFAISLVLTLDNLLRRDRAR